VSTTISNHTNADQSPNVKLSPDAKAAGFSGPRPYLAVPNPSLSLLGRRIAFSTIVQYLGKAFQLGLSILTLKLISNFLGQADYGIYAKITEFGLFFSTAANLGIFGNLVRAMADRPTDSTLFHNALILRIGSAAVFFIPGLLFLFVSAGNGSSFNHGNNIFFYGSILFFGALFFDYITSVCDAMLQANYMMGRATIALILGKLVHFTLTYLFIYAVTVAEVKGSAITVGRDVLNIFFLFAATFAGSIVTALISLYFARSKLKGGYQINWNLVKRLLISGLPFGIINIINNLYFRFLPDYFAQNALSNEQFATFNVAFRISQVASLFSTFLMFSVMPGFKEYLDGAHPQKAKALFSRVAKIMFAAGIVLVIGGTLVSNIAIELLTSKIYIIKEFWYLLPLMLLLAAISYGYDLVLITLFAMEKDYWLMRRELIALCVAMVILALSAAILKGAAQLPLIILSALAAESFMVVSGLIKIRKSWD
jgi:O-antigen/teichoic acid export membrane protein